MSNPMPSKVYVRKENALHWAFSGKGTCFATNNLLDNRTEYIRADLLEQQVEAAKIESWNAGVRKALEMIVNHEDLGNDHLADVKASVIELLKPPIKSQMEGSDG